MQGLFQNKLVLVTAIGIAVALAAWYGLTSSPRNPSLVTATAVSGGPGQELVETLLMLRAVKLEGAIFAQPSFAGLTDFSTPIVPEPVGRPNPFAPLVAGVAGAAGGGTDAAIFAPQSGNKPLPGAHKANPPRELDV